MEITASEFAHMCGVSKAAICMKIKNGTLIKNSGKKLDTDNPVNRAYIDKHRQKMKRQSEMDSLSRKIAGNGKNSDHGKADGAGTDAEKTEVTFAEVAGLNDNSNRNPAGKMLDMTIRQLIIRHGSMDSVGAYAKILRDLTAANEKEQKIQERRLAQIPKDFVTQRLFGYVDQLMGQLLDVPESVCDSIIALVTADGENCRQQLIHLLCDNLTKCIAGTKEHLTSELNSLRGKYEQQESQEDLVREVVEQMQAES